MLGFLDFLLHTVLMQLPPVVNLLVGRMSMLSWNVQDGLHPIRFTSFTIKLSCYDDINWLHWWNLIVCPWMLLCEIEFKIKRNLRWSLSRILSIVVAEEEKQYPALPGPFSSSALLQSIYALLNCECYAISFLACALIVSPLLLLWSIEFYSNSNASFVRF